MSKPDVHPAWLKIVKQRLARDKAPLCGPGHHRLVVAHLTGNTHKGLRCERCRFTCEVPLTPGEKRRVESDRKSSEANIRAIHGLGWKYQKEFYRYEPCRLTDRQFRDEKKFAASMGKGCRRPIFKPKRIHRVHKGFKWSGYELMERLERFAKRNPGVVALGCDDHYHASSTVCIIPHRSRTKYWGSTVVIAPQLGIFPATEFFLYPGHAAELARALGSTLKEGRAKLKRYGERDFWMPDSSLPKGFTAEGL